MESMRYPRDLRGYGRNPPAVNWPGGARIAVQFVVNYEEGGENNILHGDSASEAFLSEVVGSAQWPDQRHWNMETIYEYGARAGFWRLWRMFKDMEIPVTVYGVATALQRSPEQVQAMKEAGWEIASHGLKWIEYKDFEPEREKEHLMEAVRIHTAVTGERPRGWYTGRCSMNTVNLVTEEGGFHYVSDSYADDLPYWHHHNGRNQLIIPYTLDSNDMRFATAQGFNAGDQFFNYLKDSFDTLYNEGKGGSPKMMSVGLHCRLVGRPGRAASLMRFLQYVREFSDVWITRRIDIAEFWARNHPPADFKNRPSTLERNEFISRFGGIFEDSPWIAERTFDSELGPAHDSAIGLHSAMAVQFRLAGDEEKLQVLNAHPDLAGRLAEAGKLTPDSSREQSSAGLDTLTEVEREKFIQHNRHYRERFEIPFIVAVEGLKKEQIMQQFEQRLNNDKPAEFETACREVEKIALLRLKKILP